MEETETTQETRKRRALTQSQYYQLCKWVECQAIGVFATISEAANVGSTVLGFEVPESTLQSAIADTKRAIVEELVSTTQKQETQLATLERHQDSMLEMIKSLSSVVESGMNPAN